MFTMTLDDISPLITEVYGNKMEQLTHSIHVDVEISLMISL